MSEDELIRSCKGPEKRPGSYWTAEVYGFGKVLREMAWYPKILPLNIYLSHGVVVYDKPASHELNNSAPVIFFYAKHLVDEFKARSHKPCYCLISPNAYYRRKYHVKQRRDAKGTLAFLAHTTPALEDRMNFKEYGQQLRRLPEKYQPVTICLHYHDVNKGIHKGFLEDGFDVVTVGHVYNPDFIKLFYELITSFKFITSNEVGSYAFYAVDAGIPFFIYGNEPKLFNHGDGNLEKGLYTSYKASKYFQQARSLFDDPVDLVTKEQRAFAERLLGVNSSISRARLAIILYRSYVLYIVKKVRARLRRLF